MTSTQTRQTPTVGAVTPAAAAADAPAPDAVVTEAAVVEFLSTHNDFLERHAELLEQLQGGDTPEGVTSLVERQVVALRARNNDLRDRLRTLIANAKANDRTFGRMRALTLALLDATDEASLDRALAASLVADSDADHARCFVSGWTPSADFAQLAGVKGVPPLATLFAQEEPTCAAYRPEEYGRVFPGASLEEPGSIALVPLPAFGGSATLAIGAADPNRFTPGLGTMFLAYLGEVLGRTLKRIVGPVS